MSISRLRWSNLSQETRSRPDELLNTVDAFEPLAFPAGHAALGWLRSVVEQRAETANAGLAFDSVSGRLSGFVATRAIRFNVSKSRLILLQVRGHRLDPGPQRAVQIDWIARDGRTPSGFGRTLVEYALGEARDTGARALIVEPEDEPTRQMWLRHHFVPFEPRPAEGDEHPEWMWLPTGDPPQAGPS